MSERYKPKNLIRERIERGPETNPLPNPRQQIEWRDGKPIIRRELLCRLHNVPWLTCTLCSKMRR